MTNDAVSDERLDELIVISDVYPAGDYWADLCSALRELREARVDAERYRWLRSEEVNTLERCYRFWQEFNAKLTREEKMDAAIDAEMERMK